MTNTQTQNKVTRHDKIEDFLANLDTDIDVLNYVNIQDIDTSDAFNSIYEMIENNRGFDIDVIYYGDAIQYLKEYDPSLKDSINIALEYGYTLENINSEILASLLASQNGIEGFNDLQNEINTFFEELEEETNESE